MNIIELTNQALEGVSYEWRNFTPARVTWSLPVKHKEEVAPYAYKEEVRLMWKGQVVLIGSIRRCNLEMSGNAWRWVVEACDILQPLEGALCFNPTGSLSGSIGRQITMGSISDGDRARKVNVARILRWVLNSAQECGLLPGVTVEVNVDESAWMWDTSLGCDVYAGVLRKVLGARPGMVCWVDYADAEHPVVRVADGALLPSALLDRVRHRLSSVRFSPRPDLVPPAVGVVITAGNRVIGTQVYPPGSDLRQEGCVTTQVAAAVSSQGGGGSGEAASESPVWDFTKPVVEVRGEKLPTGTGETDLKWWINQIPDLAKVRGVRLGRQTRSTVQDVEGSDLTNYSTDESAQRFRLVSGQLSERCKTIKWSYIELRQVVYTDTKPPKGVEMVFNQQPVSRNGKLRYWGWVKWRGRTINTNRRKYRANKTGDSGADGGGDVPASGGGGGTPNTTDAADYSSVLRDYYELTRAMPWEGDVTALVALSPQDLVGKSLGITGLREDYRSMATIVQEVTVDLFAGTTSISTGVPAHLSLQDMLDRAKKLAAEQQGIGAEDQNEAPGGLSLQYDDEAYKSPDAPSIGPEGGMVWAEAQEMPAGYGFQVTLERSMDSEGGTITGIRMKPGKLMLNGNYIATAPEANNGEWYTDSITSGEIWLDVEFTAQGRFSASRIMCEQGPVDPLFLRLEAEDPEYPRTEPFTYSFHLATINGNEVIQHILGTIQIPVVGGTFYPYGPAV